MCSIIGCFKPPSHVQSGDLAASTVSQLKQNQVPHLSADLSLLQSAKRFVQQFLKFFNFRSDQSSRQENSVRKSPKEKPAPIDATLHNLGIICRLLKSKTEGKYSKDVLFEQKLVNLKKHVANVADDATPNEQDQLRDALDDICNYVNKLFEIEDTTSSSSKSESLDSASREQALKVVSKYREVVGSLLNNLRRRSLSSEGGDFRIPVVRASRENQPAENPNQRSEDTSSKPTYMRPPGLIDIKNTKGVSVFTLSRPKQVIVNVSVEEIGPVVFGPQMTVREIIQQARGAKH